MVLEHGISPESTHFLRSGTLLALIVWSLGVLLSSSELVTAEALSIVLHREELEGFASDLARGWVEASLSCWTESKISLSIVNVATDP